MRERLTWATAFLFLAVALFTVSVRREVYALGREIGELERDLHETCCRNQNLELTRERLLSPAVLARRARESGVAPARTPGDTPR